MRRIAKPLLKHALHFNHEGASGDKDALKVLNDMARSMNRGAEDHKHVMVAIEGLTSNIDGQEKLLKSRVVGVTCAATSFPILQGKQFQVVLMDEASQMVEPESVIPIHRYKHYQCPFSSLFIITSPLLV